MQTPAVELGLNDQRTLDRLTSRIKFGVVDGVRTLDVLGRLAKIDRVKLVCRAKSNPSVALFSFVWVHVTM